MITSSVSVDRPPRITRVRFRVLSAEDIRAMGVVEVTETTIYNRGLPAPSGIQDARLGSQDRRILCATCNRDMATCQGHTGYITLPFPMYHASFFETVLKTLRCACFFCGRVCLSDDEAASVAADAAAGRNRFAAAYTAAKPKRRCPHCGVLRPTFVRQAMSIRLEWPSDMVYESEAEEAYCKRPFTQRDALSMLRALSDEDCAVLGFDSQSSHPRNMVLTVLLVPPPSIRPTIMASEGSKTRGNDDLTCKLQDIVKRCHDVRNVMGDTPWSEIELTADLSERIARLQYEMFTIVNNAVRGQRPSVQRSGLPTRSYTGRLKGKEGRIRGNLMGKRVDSCARTVISPGPQLDVDQVGVPEKIALGVFVPEVVTEFNQEALAARVRRGAGCLDGAETVITTDGLAIQVSQCSELNKLASSLAIGWTVERPLQNDDIVAFNRQPSLHKMGFMGHRVCIVKGLTLRMNLSVTAPYKCARSLTQSAGARAARVVRLRGSALLTWSFLPCARSPPVQCRFRWRRDEPPHSPGGRVPRGRPHAHARHHAARLAAVVPPVPRHRPGFARGALPPDARLGALRLDARDAPARARSPRARAPHAAAGGRLARSSHVDGEAARLDAPARLGRHRSCPGRRRAPPRALLSRRGHRARPDRRRPIDQGAPRHGLRRHRRRRVPHEGQRVCGSFAQRPAASRLGVQ